MKKLVGIIMFMLLMLIGCSNETFDKAMEQGKLALANGEYDKALGSFELALNEEPKDKEAKRNFDNLVAFESIHMLVNDGKLTEVTNEIDKLLKKESLNSNLKKELEKMKTDVATLLAKQDEVKQKLAEANKFVAEKKFGEAKVLVEELQSKYATKIAKEPFKVEYDRVKGSLEQGLAQLKKDEEERKKKEEEAAVAAASSTRQKYLDKLDAIEAGMSDLAYLYKNGITTELIEAESTRLQRWDDALNEIYSELKIQLSKSKMDALRVKQRAWITYRDKTADDTIAKYKLGDSVGSLGRIEFIVVKASLTKERCYELVKNYI